MRGRSRALYKRAGGCMVDCRRLCGVWPTVLGASLRFLYLIGVFFGVRSRDEMSSLLMLLLVAITVDMQRGCTMMEHALRSDEFKLQL